MQQTTQNVAWLVEHVPQYPNIPISQSTCEEFPMKELVCFTIGLVIGAVVMKKSQAIDELKKELDRERFRNSPSSSTEQI